MSNIEAVPNPFTTSTAIGGLFEILKDQEWHTVSSLETWLSSNHSNLHSLSSRLRVLKKNGIFAHGTQYPAGRWELKNRRGMVQMTFRAPVSSASVDHEQVEKIVSNLVDDSMKKTIQKAVDAHMEEVNNQIKKIKESSIPILEVYRYEGDKKIKKVVQPAHAQMPKLLYLLNKGHHVYLYGDPGSGKSTAAMMAADALGRHFGYISLTVQTMDSRLLGFMSPVGKYIETEFFRCYTKGGVFCIDEMDNASGNLLTALNSCLENNQAAFPHGVFKRHKDFVVVATGNTSGGGPNPMFPERRPFDKAFQERFTYIEWTYDTRMERAVALGLYKPKADAWTDYVHTLRDYCKQHHPKVLVSPRVTFKGCEYLKDKQLTVDEILEAILFKGLDRDTKKSILMQCPTPSTLQDGKEGK